MPWIYVMRTHTRRKDGAKHTEGMPSEAFDGEPPHSVGDDVMYGGASWKVSSIESKAGSATRVCIDRSA